MLKLLGTHKKSEPLVIEGGCLSDVRSHLYPKQGKDPDMLRKQQKNNLNIIN